MKRFLVLGLLAMLVLAPLNLFATGGASVALTVTATSQSLLAANPFRHYLLITNQSSTITAFCCEGQGATGCTVALGVPIVPGGNWEINMTVAAAAPGQGVTNDIECITSSSTAAVVAVEG